MRRCVSLRIDAHRRIWRMVIPNSSTIFDFDIFPLSNMSNIKECLSWWECASEGHDKIWTPEILHTILILVLFFNDCDLVPEVSI